MHTAAPVGCGADITHFSVSSGSNKAVSGEAEIVWGGLHSCVPLECSGVFSGS